MHDNSQKVMLDLLRRVSRVLQAFVDGRLLVLAPLFGGRRLDDGEECEEQDLLEHGDLVVWARPRAHYARDRSARASGDEAGFPRRGRAAEEV